MDFAETASTPTDKVHDRLTFASAVALPLLTLDVDQIARTAVHATGSDDREANYADTSDAHLPASRVLSVALIGAPVLLAFSLGAAPDALLKSEERSLEADMLSTCASAKRTPALNCQGTCNSRDSNSRYRSVPVILGVRLINRREVLRATMCTGKLTRGHESHQAVHQVIG